MSNTRNPNRSKKRRKPRPDIAQEVTDRIVDSLEAGVVPWRPQWKTQDQPGGLPYNLSTGKAYRGANVFLLWLVSMFEGYTSDAWLTYRQAQALGAQVRRGERGTRILFYNVVERDDDDDTEEDAPQTRAFARYYTVFNRDQVSGLPEVAEECNQCPPCDEPPHGTAALDVLVDYLAQPNAPTVREGSRPAYRPATDVITIPRMGQFETVESYYGALHHEAIHSTGHATRLQRPGIVQFDRFGSDQYGAEEMVAELGAALLAAHCGILDQNLEMTAAYISGWLRKLKKDKHFFMRAAGAAQKAVDYILSAPPQNTKPTPDRDEQSTAKASDRSGDVCEKNIDGGA